MTIIRPLHTRTRIIALCIRNHSLKRQPHDLRKDLADLVFSHLVFRGELEDGRQAGFVVCCEKFGCDIYKAFLARDGAGEEEGKDLVELVQRLRCL